MKEIMTQQFEASIISIAKTREIPRFIATMVATIVCYGNNGLTQLYHREKIKHETIKKYFTLTNKIMSINYAAGCFLSRTYYIPNQENRINIMSQLIIYIESNKTAAITYFAEIEQHRANEFLRNYNF